MNKEFEGGDFLKRLFLLFLSFCLIFSMAIGSFALNYIDDNSYFVIDRGDGNTHLKPFKTSVMTEEQRQFLTDCFSDLGDYTVICSFDGSNLTVFSCPSLYPIEMGMYQNSDGVFPQFIFNNSSFQFTYMYLNASGDYIVPSNVFVSTISRIPFNNYSLFLYSNDTACFNWIRQYEQILTLYRGETLVFSDDLGLLDSSGGDPGGGDPSSSEPGSSEPSSSEPGSSEPGSSEPGSSEPGSSDPGGGGSSSGGGSSGGGDGEFLPGTPEALVDFCNFYIDVITTLLPVGIFIFAICTGIGLLPKILRIFIKINM